MEAVCGANGSARFQTLATLCVTSVTPTNHFLSPIFACWLTCMVKKTQNLKGWCLASSKRLSWPVFQTRTTRKPPRRAAHATTKAVAAICGSKHSIVRHWGVGAGGGGTELQQACLVCQCQSTAPEGKMLAMADQCHSISASAGIGMATVMASCLHVCLGCMMTVSACHAGTTHPALWLPLTLLTWHGLLCHLASPSPHPPSLHAWVSPSAGSPMPTRQMSRCPTCHRTSQSAYSRTGSNTGPHPDCTTHLLVVDE